VGYAVSLQLVTLGVNRCTGGCSGSLAGASHRRLIGYTQVSSHIRSRQSSIGIGSPV
jgi:hypothetical protein